MEIRDLRNRTGLSQSRFAEYFGIPVKTIQKWENHGSTPAPYIVGMIERILDLECQVNDLKGEVTNGRK